MEEMHRKILTGDVPACKIHVYDESTTMHRN